MERAFHAEASVKEDWDWWHAARRRVLSAVLRRELDRLGWGERELDLVDVGCGTGGTTAGLAGGHRLVGCEFAPEAARAGSLRLGGRVVRATASALPLRDESQDLVFALDVLEHFEDDALVLREVARVLRPGGLLFATVPSFDFLWGPHDVYSHHFRRYRLPGLRSVLETSGFELIRDSYFNTLLFPAVAAVQLLRRGLRGSAPVQSGTDLPSQRGPLNALLRAIFGLESHLLPHARLPFGVSAFALARRKECGS
jgi:SAM-dependent methyltransferase